MSRLSYGAASRRWREEDSTSSVSDPPAIRADLRSGIYVYMTRYIYLIHIVQQVCTDSAVRRLRRGYLGKLSRGMRGP